MEFTIGQLKFKVIISGERNILQIQIPLNNAEVGITIRHSPSAPNGEVFGMGIDLTEKPKPSSIG